LCYILPNAHKLPLSLTFTASIEWYGLQIACETVRMKTITVTLKYSICEHIMIFLERFVQTWIYMQWYLTRILLGSIFGNNIPVLQTASWLGTSQYSLLKYNVLCHRPRVCSIWIHCSTSFLPSLIFFILSNLGNFILYSFLFMIPFILVYIYVLSFFIYLFYYFIFLHLLIQFPQIWHTQTAISHHVNNMPSFYVGMFFVWWIRDRV
jgi:hypothetical protein